jgi:hypothetical protein
MFSFEKKISAGGYIPLHPLSILLFLILSFWFLLGKRQKGKKAKINQGKPYKHGSQCRHCCK